MKTFGMSFGNIQAVQSGQKSAMVNAKPQLVVSSTTGKFTITSPVSKALNIAVGENVMFFNNIAGVEQAIQTKNDDIVAYAAEKGYDLTSPADCDKMLAELTVWFISKGVLMYNGKGEPIMATERYTKEDKAKYLAEHGMEFVEANREYLVEKFGEMSDEELLANINPNDIESPKYHAASGSKTATTASTTGVGCQLNFTDTAIWGALKADLGDNASKKNRIFDVVLDNPVDVPYNNGRENLTVIAYPLSFVEDVNPIARVKKEA